MLYVKFCGDSISEMEKWGFRACFRVFSTKPPLRLIWGSKTDFVPPWGA